MKNLFQMTPFELKQLKLDALKRMPTLGHNAFTYYINNVISAQGSEKRFGNAICDLVYWVEDKSRGEKRLDLDIVGYVANECFYGDKYDFRNKTPESVITDIIEIIVPIELQKQFKENINRRYLKNNTN